MKNAWNFVSPILINNCFIKSPLFIDIFKENQIINENNEMIEYNFSEINENIDKLNLEFPMYFEEFIEVEKNKNLK